MHEGENYVPIFLSIIRIIVWKLVSLNNNVFCFKGGVNEFLFKRCNLPTQIISKASEKILLNF